MRLFPYLTKKIDRHITINRARKYERSMQRKFSVETCIINEKYARQMHIMEEL